MIYKVIQCLDDMILRYDYIDLFDYLLNYSNKVCIPKIIIKKHKLYLVFRLQNNHYQFETHTQIKMDIWFDYVRFLVYKFK